MMRSRPWHLACFSPRRGGYPPAPVPIAATVHPASVLRSPDAESRDAAYAGLVADLERIAAAVRG
jgi:hypothetical protein